MSVAAPVAGWWTRPLAVFDLETTGIDPMADRIVTASLAVVYPDGRVDTKEDWLLNPGIPIPDGAAAVHGVTTARAEAEGTDYRQGLKSILAALEWCAEHGPLVVFNAPYDLTMSYAEAVRLDLRKEAEGFVRLAQVIDPLTLDRGLDKWRKGTRKLGPMCDYYGVRLDAAHRADEDAVAAGRLAFKMAERWPKLREWSLDQLQDRQREMFLEWLDGYASYCRQKGITPPAGGEDWPIRHPEALDLWHRVRAGEA